MDILNDDEILFVGTAEAEHVEMYLKAVWHIKERGEDVKISTIAKMLNIRQPSVVQMLKKLNDKNLVNYNKAGVKLTEEGDFEIAVQNAMDKVLDIDSAALEVAEIKKLTVTSLEEKAPIDAKTAARMKRKHYRRIGVYLSNACRYRRIFVQ